VAHADEIKGKVGESLRDNLDQLPLSRQLTTIKCDVELDLTIADLAMRPAQIDKLQQIYTEMEFKTWLSNLSTTDGKPIDGQAGKSAVREKVKANYETVLDKKSFEQWLKKLSKAEQFAFDTETTSLNYMQARVVGVSFAVEVGEAAYVPFAHDYTDAPAQLSEQDVLGGLKALLEDESKKKIGQNLKYDANEL